MKSMKTDVEKGQESVKTCSESNLKMEAELANGVVWKTALRANRSKRESSDWYWPPMAS